MRWIQTIPLLFTQVLYLTLGGALFKTMEESEEEDYKEWTLRFYKEFLGKFSGREFYSEYFHCTLCTVLYCIDLCCSIVFFTLSCFV